MTFNRDHRFGDGGPSTILTESSIYVSHLFAVTNIELKFNELSKPIPKYVSQQEGQHNAHKKREMDEGDENVLHRLNIKHYTQQNYGFQGFLCLQTQQ